MNKGKTVTSNFHRDGFKGARRNVDVVFLQLVDGGKRKRRSVASQVRFLGSKKEGKCTLFPPFIKSVDITISIYRKYIDNERLPRATPN